MKKKTTDYKLFTTCVKNKLYFAIIIIIISTNKTKSSFQSKVIRNSFRIRLPI